MSDDDYNGYLFRAEFCSFAGRTVEGCHGLMFQKPLSVTSPESLKQYLDNVDGKGNDLYKFVNDATFDVMKTNWGGVLLDAPSGDELNKKEAEENGVSPYMTFYRAEDIHIVQKEIRGRQEVVTLIVLHEIADVPSSSDPYVTEEKDRYRVLKYDENGYYVQELYNEAEVLISTYEPKKFGARLTKIPFYFLPNTEPTIPMFMPVIDVNASWYHKSADYENGLHWCGVPTPVVLGCNPPTHTDDNGDEIAEDVHLGGSKVLFFPEGTGAHYLELSGSGLGNISSAMAQDEDRMAILGARVISQERKGVESAETARIHRSGENSVIATFANEMSKVFTRILRDYLEWCEAKEIKEDISCKINTDYDISKMSPTELTALVALWQQGGISKDVMFKNLQEGEVVPADVSFEEMETKIQEEKEASMQQALVNMKAQMELQNSEA